MAKTFRVISCTALIVAFSVANASFASANTIIDLMTAGNTSTQTATTGGTFVVTQVPDQSTGTGVIDPFLRIQQTGAERGFNSGSAPILDDKAGAWTSPLLLTEIPLIDIGGVFYRQFLLDINQNVNNELSLNQIQIFQSPGDDTSFTLDEAGGAGSQFAVISGLGTEVFRMSSDVAGRDYEIQLDYALNSGSGSGDMYLYVRNSVFNPAISNVIFFSQFGAPNGAYASNDGFEEWAVIQGGITTCPAGDPRCDVPIVPEPASLLLLATGLGVVARRFRRRQVA